MVVDERVRLIIWLTIVLITMPTTATAESPLTTVLSKPAKSASLGMVELLSNCAAPKLPMTATVGSTLVSSTVVIDRVRGREVSRRTYRFSQALDKVLPELERAGAVLRSEPLGDLCKQPVGTVWHGYDVQKGLMSVRELTCSRIDR